MSAVAQNTRILVVTAGNIRQSHLSVSGHYDFFPPECLDPARANDGRERGAIRIHLDGLGEIVATDIPVDPATGRPRSALRGRSWVRRFFEHHRISAGDRLALDRVGKYEYRLGLAPRASSEERQPTAAEFFAGIGLVRVALERCGWAVRFANDIDPAKAEIYRHNWPSDDHLHVGDIHDLKAGDIPDCDLFTASFPCNDLSIAGKWQGLEGKESSAFWGLIRILHELGARRPKLLLVENVVGFLQRNGGGDLENALLAMNELGYSVDVLILNAVHWVPQSRPRLFIVASLDPPGEPPQFAFESDVRPQALCRFINSRPHIRWAIRHLPALPPPGSRLEEIIEDLPEDDPHWWSAERRDYFMNQLSERHAEVARRMIAGDAVTYATAFRRVRKGRSMAELRTDGIAGCLRTPRGGSGRQILFAAGKGEARVRLLTARECARLQGAPDSFIINVPQNQALFGFGDAVCVPAVEWIIEHCLSPLAAVESRRLAAEVCL